MACSRCTWILLAINDGIAGPRINPSESASRQNVVTCRAPSTRATHSWRQDARRAGRTFRPLFQFLNQPTKRLNDATRFDPQRYAAIALDP